MAISCCQREYYISVVEKGIFTGIKVDSTTQSRQLSRHTS